MSFLSQFKIKAIPKDTSLEGISGVYRIWFGDKYYIGSSYNIAARIKKHTSIICSMIVHQSYKCPIGSYKRIADQVIKQDIRFGEVEILEMCDRRQLLAVEYGYLKRFQQDPRILNVFYDGNI